VVGAHGVTKWQLGEAERAMRARRTRRGAIVVVLPNVPQPAIPIRLRSLPRVVLDDCLRPVSLLAALADEGRP
jgi:hypothetical protein